VSDALDERLGALAQAVELARGRLDEEDTEAAQAVVLRAGERLGLGLEATVVALAGATGAGKSSLFNALAGAELSSAGRRRPTTATASAAVWGQVGGALLDWLRVPRRHHIDGSELDGLVLLDLPDFDSIERAHRVEVERVLALADLVVWVADPQKYADAALHERYLRPLAAYAPTMLVVLNHADLLAPDALAACVADLRALLSEDGLGDASVLTVSAHTGEGIDELRAAISQRVAAREAALARLATDVDGVVAALGASCEPGAGGVVDEAPRARLLDALAQAAGVPAVVAAVDRAHRRRGALVTGWPPVRWLRRLRPDPLRRLRLGDASATDATSTPQRTSLPGPSAVQSAQVSGASRALAAGAASALPDPWPALVRSAATAHEDAVADRLDRAVGAADLRVTAPRWWRVAGAAQRLLSGVMAGGGLWLLVLVGLGYLQLGDVLPLPEIEGIALPTLLLLGGAGAGVLAALIARVLNGAGARRRARRAQRVLRAQVQTVADELVIAPVTTELDAHAALCAALDRAGADRGRGRPRVRRRVASAA